MYKSMGGCVPAGGYDMGNAPRDGTPILAWCSHEMDPVSLDEGKTLTAYACACEAYVHVANGFNVVSWVPESREGSWEEGYYEVPGYWALHDEVYECCANPIRWWPLPEAPVIVAEA